MVQESNFLELFASKRIITIIVEVMKIFLISLLSFWWLFILVTCLILISIFKWNLIEFTTHPYTYVSGIILLGGLPGFFIEFRRIFKIKVFNKKDGITINELIIVKDEDYIDRDFHASEITTRSQDEIRKIEEVYSSYKISSLNIFLRHHQRIFYLLKNFKSLRQSIQKENQRNQILFSLLAIRNYKNDLIEFEVLSGPIHGYTIMDDFRTTFSNLTLKNPADYKRLVSEVSKIFISMVSIGSFNNATIVRDKHNILNSNRNLLFSSIDNVKNMIIDDELLKITSFKNGWDCEVEILRCHLLLDQAEYEGALKCVFSAIRVNPFHPFRSYEEFKMEYTRKKAYEFTELEINLLPEFAKRGEPISGLEELAEIVPILFETLKYPDRPFFQETIVQIQKQASSVAMDEIIEERLKQSFCDGIMKDLIRGDVLKFLPIPTDGTYSPGFQLARCPEVATHYEKVLEFDDTFAFMYIKLSSILFLYYSSLPTSAIAESQLSRSSKLMQKGIHLFAELGINLRK